VRNLYQELPVIMGVPETAGPLIGVTAFWILVSIIGPLVVPKSRPDRGVIQTMIVTTAACCWLFWICITLSQVNPLFGPQVDTTILRVLQVQWPR